MPSLLDALRSEEPSQQHNKWHGLVATLTAALPDYQHRKVTLIRGEVIVQGSVRAASGSRHLYAVIHNEATAGNPAASGSFPKAAQLQPQERPAGARPAAMGISRYMAEAETNYYTDPWVAWVTPAPETFTAWLLHIMTTTTEDTPNMEARRSR